MEDATTAESERKEDDYRIEMSEMQGCDYPGRSAVRTLRSEAEVEKSVSKDGVAEGGGRRCAFCSAGIGRGAGPGRGGAVGDRGCRGEVLSQLRE